MLLFVHFHLCTINGKQLNPPDSRKGKTDVLLFLCKYMQSVDLLGKVRMVDLKEELIYGYESPVVFLLVTGCFGLSHYKPTPQTASRRMIRSELASQAQLVMSHFGLLHTSCCNTWGPN